MKKDLYKILNNILKVIIIITIVIKLIISDYENIGMLIIAFLLTHYEIILNKLFKIKLNDINNLLMVLFIFLAQYLGSCLNFYDLFSWWDIMLHFISGIIMFLIGIDLYNLINKKQNNSSILTMLLFATFFSFAIGNLWEIWEYTTDAILKLDSQKAGELVGRLALKDTMTDLIAAAFGTVIILVYKILKLRGDKK